MNSIQEWADFYKGLKIWVYPYKDYSDQFHWLDWKNFKDFEYESETFDWSSANGINVIAGKNGIMVLRFRKDNSPQYTTNSKQNDYATKMNIAMGCILVIDIAIITGIITACNALSLAEWFGMFLMSLGLVADLIYIMSH